HDAVELEIRHLEQFDDPVEVPVDGLSDDAVVQRVKVEVGGLYPDIAADERPLGAFEPNGAEADELELNRSLFDRKTQRDLVDGDGLPRRRLHVGEIRDLDLAGDAFEHAGAGERETKLAKVDGGIGVEGAAGPVRAARYVDTAG